jgi:hypothetical protein
MYLLIGNAQNVAQAKKNLKWLSFNYIRDALQANIYAAYRVLFFARAYLTIIK